MAAVTGTFDEVKGHNGGNIRKVLRMAVLLAPWEQAGTNITSLVDTSNEVVVPDGYTSVGILDKEAAFTSTPSLNVSEVSGYGYGMTLRRDIVSRNTSLAFTGLETVKRMLEVYYGIDLTANLASSIASGKNEIVITEPDRPDTLYWRCLALGADGDGANTIYMADYYPKVTLSEVAALASSETDPRRYAVTLGVDVDTVVGTGHRQFIAGPGLSTAEMLAMGWQRSA
jgi:hypothetical protein